MSTIINSTSIVSISKDYKFFESNLLYNNNFPYKQSISILELDTFLLYNPILILKRSKSTIILRSRKLVRPTTTYIKGVIGTQNGSFNSRILGRLGYFSYIYSIIGTQNGSFNSRILGRLGYSYLHSIIGTQNGSFNSRTLGRLGYSYLHSIIGTQNGGSYNSKILSTIYPWFFINRVLNIQNGGSYNSKILSTTSPYFYISRVIGTRVSGRFV
jgi:hypothetical protein